MAQKPKAGGVKKKESPKAPQKAKDEKQFERFVETARTYGVDDNTAKFESAFKKIVKAKRS